MAKVIMIQGTMSNAGKSFLAAGLCRIFKQDGLKTAPFKSQNMALNSYITKDGLEMGRAQVMQAEAAGIEPEAAMNPILLKPTSNMGSQLIVNGEVRGNYPAAEYFKMKKSLIPDIMDAYNSLASRYDVIVVEGAGSPAEINLRENDIVNMAMAREAVGDDDRILVEPFTGLTVEYAAKRGACAILRGLRAVSDFEYEFQLALMNRRLQRDIQTVFLMTDYQWLFISSTIVKAAASHGADIVGLVPENVRLRLMEKYQRGEVRQATPCLSAPYGGFRVNK